MKTKGLAVVRHARKKEVREATKGFRARRNSSYRVAKPALQKALLYSFRDRRKLKSNMRKLWIIRINAALRQIGLTYSKFIYKLNKSNLDFNRKILANIAYSDIKTFEQIVASINAAV